jgi:hypothetical protein
MDGGGALLARALWSPLVADTVALMRRYGLSRQDMDGLTEVAWQVSAAGSRRSTSPRRLNRAGSAVRPTLPPVGACCFCVE